MEKDILEDCTQAIIDSSHGTNNVKTDSLPGLMIKMSIAMKTVAKTRCCIPY